MLGLGDGGGRVRCQIIAPGDNEEIDIRTGEGPPMVGIGKVLNHLGQDGWELVAYDTTTHRGVLKRPLVENGVNA
jgi:hypothetical protein